MTEDWTLDELREKLAPDIAANAAFDGWGKEALALAAEAAGVDAGVAKLAFPGGAADMIDAWFAHVDRAMLARLPAGELAMMKVRARIAGLVEARLAVVEPDREALRRAVAVLALPANVARAARLGWRSVDTIWRAAGDVATDYNHYTKRAILLGVYAATISVFLDDESEGFADTRAFLGRRIDGIMRFEKAKAGVHPAHGESAQPVALHRPTALPGGVTCSSPGREGGSLPVQRLQHVVDPRRVTDREHLPAARGAQRIALPVAHSPARTLDDRRQRGEVVERQACFADQVQLPARD